MSKDTSTRQLADSPGSGTTKKGSYLFVAVAVVAALGVGGAAYLVSVPSNESVGAGAAPDQAPETSSPPTSVDSSESAATEEAPAEAAVEPLCGVSLPKQISIFELEDQDKVTRTEVLDDDGRLVYTASFEETTIELKWPAVDRLEEREPEPSWSQGSGTSLMGEEVRVGQEFGFASVQLFHGMPLEHYVQVDPGEELSGGACATFSKSATYQGERGQTFAHDFTDRGRVGMDSQVVDLQPLVLRTIESDTPPVLDKSPHNGCTGETIPLDQLDVDSPVRWILDTARSTPLEALTDALESTRFTDKRDFTEIMLPNSKIIYALDLGLENGEPTGEYYLAFHIEEQSDGWLATHIEYASGC